MTASVICTGNEPFSAEQTRQIINDFTRDGVYHLRDVLNLEEVAELKAGVDRAFDDPDFSDDSRTYSEIVRARLFEVDRVFRDLLVREPIISLVEALLGDDCHAISLNAIRNPPGQAIDTFHADDFVWFPLPDEIDRFDARIQYPTLLVNVHFALTDVPDDSFGPLQYIPGSHYSGRRPNAPSEPTWEGQSPISLFTKAGDAYLQHPMVWHRGASNTSGRTRYVCGPAYGKRFIAQRFYPFLNYRMPDEVLDGADERLLRVLGKHERGAYG